MLLIARLLSPELAMPDAPGVALRAIVAAAAACLIALAVGPRAIAWLARRFREPNKSPSPDVLRLHGPKRATPTMGGIWIVGCVLAAVLVCGDWANPLVSLAMTVTVMLCLVGMADDWIKIATPRPGLQARAKFAAQTAIALFAATIVYRVHAADGQVFELALPGFGSIELGLWFVPLAAAVIVGSSNGVNLTDGLDGLAAGCLVCAAATIALVCYVAGDAAWSDYLGIPHIPAAGEMAVIAAALVGGLLGFLWFNCHPASVFMGDSGSLPLGGLLGLIAVVARQELLLVTIGGVFVVETLSVMLQVGSFRLFGRRLLRCAPLHHHFQLAGWSEDKIVVRFWIAGAICSIAALVALRGPSPALRQANRPAPAEAQAQQELPETAELF